MAIQIQTITKDGQGNPLSILSRQFFSFSYGGRNIEDFDLVATFPNDRLDKTIYAEFNDTVSEYSELDGQLFWLSSFTAGKINFTLSTDGITVSQLEDFKSWFRPGIERELILSENHNRGILARVASAPAMSLLPFEQDIEVEVNNTIYTTKTSLYKGDITLELVMDDPKWYSLNSIINEITPETLKIIHEDGIPHESMIHTHGFFADNYYSFLNEEGYVLEKNN